MKLVYFKNGYWEEYSIEKNEDALACVYIDGYPEDENESGEVVVAVWITKHKDIIVDWHNNAYRMNDTVLELIEDSKAFLINEFKR